MKLLGGTTWEGQGPDLHSALEDAWGKAKAAKAQPGHYKVKKIRIRCENPITTYFVQIGP